MLYIRALIFLLSLHLSSCSVMMAASQKGVPIERIEKAEHRDDLIALGGALIETKQTEEGDTVEVFSFPVKGSVSRALLYGFLDLGTLFLWELAGTPIESYISQDKPLLIQATLYPDEQIQKLELY